MTAGRRVLLLVPARSYRAADFMLAATKLGLDLTVASDGALPVGGRPVIPVHPGDPDHAAGQAAAATGRRCGPPPGSAASWPRRGGTRPNRCWSRNTCPDPS